MEVLELIERDDIAIADQGGDQPGKLTETMDALTQAKRLEVAIAGGNNACWFRVRDLDVKRVLDRGVLEGFSNERGLSNPPPACDLEKEPTLPRQHGA